MKVLESLFNQEQLVGISKVDLLFFLNLPKRDELEDDSTIELSPAKEFYNIF